jgi:hypothetical protein
MICNRCGNELPSDTPVCRSCGPVSLIPGSGALPPLPQVSFSIPGLAPAPAAPASLARPLPAPAVTPSPTPPAPPRPERQSKAQRRRAALAKRAPDGESSSTNEDSATGDRAVTADGDEPSLVGLPPPRPITTIARLDVFVGVTELLVAWAFIGGRVAHESTRSGPIGDGVFFAATGFLSLVAGAGLVLVTPVGWYAHLALVAVGLLWGSWSDVVGAATAVYLLRPGVKLLLSGRDPASLEEPERARIRKDVESPLLVPVAVLFLGLVAALRLLPTLWELVSTL